MRVALLVSFAVVTSATAQDVVPFPRHRLHPILGEVPMALADVDGDTIPDLITPATGSGVPATGPGVEVRMGHGNGSFAAAITIAGPFAGTVDGDDVTGDGLADIVTVFQAAPDDSFMVAVYVNTGGGAFAEPVLSMLPFVDAGGDLLFLETELADIDVDGSNELVIRREVQLLTQGLTTKLIVASSSGSGSMSPITVLDDYVEAFATGDFDSDGLLDVGAPTYYELAVYPGLATGQIDPSPFLSPGLGTYTLDLATSDFDLDGNLDLCMASTVAWPATEIQLWTGLGDGTFGLSQQVPNPGIGYHIAAGDLDGSGWPDVAVQSSPDAIATLLNDNGGSLLGPTSIPTPSATFKPFDLRIVDLDANGKEDVVYRSALLPGLGDGSVEDGELVAVSWGKPVEVEAVDLDGDGEVDLVSTLNAASGALAVALGVGDGTFIPAAEPLGGPWIQTRQLAAGDLDGDGDQDLFLTTGGTAFASSRWFNDGTGLAFGQQADGIAKTCKDLKLDDLNGDGDLDLVTATAEVGGVFVRVSDGQGGFAPETSVGMLGNALTVELADIDMDGISDVAATLGDSNSVGLARGLGNGAFTSPSSIPFADVPTEVVAADFDDDGAPDLAVATSSTSSTIDTISVLFQVSSFVFAPPTVISVREGPLFADLDAVDLDDDGHCDLLATLEYFDLHLHFLHNQGDGQFDPGQDFITAEFSKSTALADFDGDGLLDAATACQGQPGLFVMPNILPPFPNLGYQHATSFGIPRLEIDGEPVPGQLVTIGFENLPAGAVGFLILGLDFAPKAFHGGTLVPSPNFAVPMGAGDTLASPWPPLPIGTKVFAQAWFAVGGEFAGTNAIYGATK